MKHIDFAALMYRHLPEVWRERDNAIVREDVHVDGDLHSLLVVYGDVLDALYRTIRQRYYDTFPDFDDDVLDSDGTLRGCQSWVLPYIARLLDVTPLSPMDSGRRAEIQNAIGWRQRKGTLVASEEIAEKVGDIEIELQEGWQIVAVTPRPGFTLLPAASFGEQELAIAGPDANPAAWLAPARARHADLRNGTVDFRWCSRAVRARPTDPTVQRTRFHDIACPPGSTPAFIAAARKKAREEGIAWRQANRHGAPCFPGSFQDVSARTVDLRVPDWRRGHVHPRRVVLHAAPFDGWCRIDAAPTTWAAIEAAIGTSIKLPDGVPVLLESADGAVTLRPAALGTRVRVTGAIVHAGPDAWRFVDLDLPTRPVDISCVGCRFQDEENDAFDADILHAEWSTLEASMLALHAMPAGDPVRVTLLGDDLVLLGRHVGDQPAKISGAAMLALDRQWRVEHLWFDDALRHDAGRLHLEACAVRAVESSVADLLEPTVEARSCLFGGVRVGAGFVSLEYCTVLGECVAPVLQASDCIFLELPKKDVPGTPQLPDKGCIRFSRVPNFPEDDGAPHASIARATCTTATPIFLSDIFGDAGCGVLHPATADAVRFGAEDGGEMGAHHEDKYVLRERAVLDKLADYLPLGVTPVLVPDASMRCAPPEAT